MKYIINLIAASVSCTLSSKADKIDVNSVTVTSGIISKKRFDDKMVNMFLVIPFAAPPTGDFRRKVP